MNLSPQTRLAQSSSIPSAELEKGRVFLDIDNGDYLSLEGPGLAIWEALEAPLTVDELFERLCDRYAVRREQCEHDTMPFLLDMLSAGLVQEVPSEPTP